MSTWEVKSRVVMARAVFSKEKALYTSKLDLNWRKKPAKRYIWSIALSGAENWTLLAVDQKYLASFEIWCLRRMEKISWTDHVRNEEVLHRVKGERNIIHTVKRRKTNWIGHILHRNCLLNTSLKGRWKVREEEEDVSSYRMTFSERDGAGNWKKTQ